MVTAWSTGAEEHGLGSWAREGKMVWGGFELVGENPRKSFLELRMGVGGTRSQRGPWKGVVSTVGLATLAASSSFLTSGSRICSCSS